jgi:hypothetical protein
MGLTNVVVSQREPLGRGHYPFVDTATLLSNEGASVSPAMFADAIVYPPGGGERQFISRLELTGSQLMAVVSDPQNELCSGTLQLDGINRKLELFDPFGRPAGLLLGGQHYSDFAGGLPGEGTYNFNIESTELTPTCVAPQPQVRLDGVLTADGQFLSGELWLVGKGGVVLEVLASRNAVRVHAVGDPLFKRRQCEADGTPFIAPIPLRKIQMILMNHGNATLDLVPDEFGDILMTTGSNQAPDNVLRFEPVEFGLRLRSLGNVINLDN